MREAPIDLQGTIPSNGLLYLIIRNVAFSVPLRGKGTTAERLTIDESAQEVGHWSQLPFLKSMPSATLAEIVKNTSALLHVDCSDFTASYQVVYQLAAGALKRCRLFRSDNAPICDEDVSPAEHYSFISSGSSKSTAGGFQLQESSQGGGGGGGGGGGKVDRLVFETPTEDSAAVKVTRQFRLTESSVQLSPVERSSRRQSTPSEYTFKLPAFGFINEPNQFTHTAHLWLPSEQVVAIFDNDELQNAAISENVVSAKYVPFSSYFACTANAPKYPRVPPTAYIPHQTKIALAGDRLIRNPMVIGGVVFAAIVLLTGGCLVSQLTQGKTLPKKRNQTRFEERHFIAKDPRRQVTTSGLSSSRRTTTSISAKANIFKNSRKAKSVIR